jgi:hypothetical protein
VRAGELVTYVIRLTNPSKRAVRHMRTCDHLPAGPVKGRTFGWMFRWRTSEPAKVSVIP